MRAFAASGLIAAGLATAPYLGALDPVLAAVITVGVGVLLACVVSGNLSPYAVALGAGAAFALMALGPVSAVLAGAVTVLALHAERAVRARSLIGVGAHLGLSAVTGGVATWLIGTQTAAPVTHALVAGAMAAVVLAAPFLLRVDDAVAFQLRQLAVGARSPMRWRLLRGVALRRRMMETTDDLPPRTRVGLERAWWELVRLARAARRAPRASAALLETKLSDHLGTLARAQSAAGAAGAMATGLDGAALAAVRVEGERLEAEAQALAEIDDERHA